MFINEATKHVVLKKVTRDKRRILPEMPGFERTILRSDCHRLTSVTAEGVSWLI